MLDNILAYIPNILKVLILLLIAWGVSVLANKVVINILLKTNMDVHLAKCDKSKDVECGKSKVKSITKIVYLLVFLLFVPSMLNALSMESVPQPINNMVNNLLGFIPNLIGAGIILFIGYFLANILRDLTNTLLKTMNLGKYTDSAPCGGVK